MSPCGTTFTCSKVLYYGIRWQMDAQQGYPYMCAVVMLYISLFIDFKIFLQSRKSNKSFVHLPLDSRQYHQTVELSNPSTTTFTCSKVLFFYFTRWQMDFLTNDKPSIDNKLNVSSHGDIGCHEQNTKILNLPSHGACGYVVKPREGFRGRSLQ